MPAGLSKDEGEVENVEKEVEVEMTDEKQEVVQEPDRQYNKIGEYRLAAQERKNQYMRSEAGQASDTITLLRVD